MHDLNTHMDIWSVQTIRYNWESPVRIIWCQSRQAFQAYLNTSIFHERKNLELSMEWDGYSRIQKPLKHRFLFLGQSTNIATRLQEKVIVSTKRLDNHL